MRRSVFASAVLTLCIAAAPAAAQSNEGGTRGASPAELTAAYVSASALLRVDVAAGEPVPLGDAAFRKGSLGEHVLLGAVIGAGVGMALVAYLNFALCDGGATCGSGQYVRGAVAFGAVGAALGALTYAAQP